MNVAKHYQKFRCSAPILIIKVEWPFPLEWEMFPQYNYILLHTETVWKNLWIRVAKQNQKPQNNPVDCAKWRN